MSKKFSFSKLLIASNNSGKVKEITKLLAPYNIEITSVTDKNIEEPEETEKTFTGNSRLKAEYYGKLLNLPALADDSGICIEELDGYPGVYSARIAGRDKSFQNAFTKIEEKLALKGLKSSAAHFICSLAIWYPDGSLEDFEGRVDGVISFPARGEKGFGYDPIFIPNGYDKTFAQMEPQDKHKISHRALAFQKFIESCF